MGSGRGKGKGSAFEREICKKLSLWVTAGKREDVFWRSAMSGGRATLGHRKGKDLRRQAGDICAVAPEGHALTGRYYIETKFYKDLDISSFLFGKGKLAQFWRDTCREAAKHYRDPLLIARQNRTPTLLLMKKVGPELMMVPGPQMTYRLDNENEVVDSVRIVLFDKLMSRPYAFKKLLQPGKKGSRLWHGQGY